MSNLTRWNPRSDLEVTDFFRPFESLMNDLWRNWPTRFEGEGMGAMLRPAMDVVEDDNTLTVRLDLPGMSPEDVNVEVENNTLTVSGEMGDTMEKEGERYHYRERSYGSFQRSIRLPNTIDTEDIDANFENGVLNITMPKRHEAKPKQIAVKSKK
jgi:HSP20 family protein